MGDGASAAMNDHIAASGCVAQGSDRACGDAYDGQNC